MTELSLKIIELFNKHYSSERIQNELNCSEYVVNYWLNPEIRRRKINNHRKYARWKKVLSSKIKDFYREVNRKVDRFTMKDVLDRFTTKTKCYLTGRDIDLTKDKYNFDHIVPISKGGGTNIENLGITIPIANASKSFMTVEEYLNLCEEVLRYHKPELFK